jgi:DNA repair protein RecN (Recombination protein N)
MKDSGKITAAMLNQLSLRDFAVVSRADVDFGTGMTVLSGETGAGKSLIVDALLWLTGARADAAIVRHGAERAELTAEFSLEPDEPGLSWLRENELDEAGICTLRRVIRADGGSRAWINGRPATLAQLSELGSLLVEIHGQHEHQALLERGHQLELLDAFGRNAVLRTEVASLARRWQELARELDALDAAGNADDRLEFLQHQWSELERESLDPQDIESLVHAHRRQSSAASLLAAYDTALLRLSSDEGLSPVRGLHQVSLELSRQLDSEPRLANVLELIESASIQLDEAASAVERLRDELDLDPSRLQELEDRLGRLHDLARKHRVPMPALGARREAIAAELETLRGSGERRLRLLQERDEIATRWRDVAARLGQARAASAQALSVAVCGLMSELGMAGGVFEVQLLPVEDAKPSTLGTERCEFLVSANPGQPPRPLRKIASGGELARISLAIEVALLGLDSVPTMVFDEVDAGIGGAVAEVVGQKLRTLGAERQVFCVTHLPQVAAQGHRHYKVSKAVAGQQTHSVVSELDDKARIEELARMLGGVEIAKETRANAKQMLAKAQTD